jgi:hypothetical protein
MKFQCIACGNKYDDSREIWEWLHISLCPWCSETGLPTKGKRKLKKKRVPVFALRRYEFSNYDGSGGKIPRYQGID